MELIKNIVMIDHSEHLNFVCLELKRSSGWTKLSTRLWLHWLVSQEACVHVHTLVEDNIPLLQGSPLCP